MKKKILYGSAMFGLGFLLSSGMAFASSGNFVQSLFGSSSVDVNGKTVKVHDLTYHGTRYYPLGNLSLLLSRANVNVHQSTSSLVVNSPYQSTTASISLNGNNWGTTSQIDYKGSAYLNAGAIMGAFNSAGVTTNWDGQSLNLSLPIEPPALPKGKTISLLKYPQYAVGPNDNTNLGNEFNWQIISRVRFQDNNERTLNYPYLYGFTSQYGSSGSLTYDRIFRTYGKLKSFTAMLDVGSALNSTGEVNDTGTLTITDGNGNVLYTSGPVPSTISTPITVSVNLSGVSQIEIELTEDSPYNPNQGLTLNQYQAGGLGLIDPVFVKK